MIQTTCHGMYNSRRQHTPLAPLKGEIYKGNNISSRLPTGDTYSCATSILQWIVFFIKGLSNPGLNSTQTRKTLKNKLVAITRLKSQCFRFTCFSDQHTLILCQAVLCFNPFSSKNLICSMIYHTEIACVLPDVGNVNQTSTFLFSVKVTGIRYMETDIS